MNTRCASTVSGLMLLAFGVISCSEPAPSNRQPYTCQQAQACDTPYQRRCEGQSLYVCRDFGGCQEWVLLQQCSSHHACVSGACGQDASANAPDDILAPDLWSEPDSHWSQDTYVEPDEWVDDWYIPWDSDTQDSQGHDWCPILPGDCAEYMLYNGKCDYECQCSDAAYDEYDCGICEGSCPAYAECGYDGCGNLCGTCDTDYVCEAYSCVYAPPGCVDICGNAQCGFKGECDCGHCFGNDVCSDFECICEPACWGKECGDDGCGGACGICTPSMACGSDGFCAPKGDCDGKTYSSAVCKINALDIGQGGLPGEALDVDMDPDTCAPESACQDGLNNQLYDFFASLSSFIDVHAEMAKGLNSGQTTLLLELVNANTQGNAFILNLYSGTAVLPQSSCDFQSAACAYYVLPLSLDTITCQPLSQFTNAKISGTQLTAGGANQVIQLRFPMFESANIILPLRRAQVKGSATLNPVNISSGLLAGALRKAEIFAAVEAIPPEVVDELPVSIDMIKNMLDTFIVPDIDTDGDDEPDGASLAFKFNAIPGSISGLAP